MESQEPAIPKWLDGQGAVGGNRSKYRAVTATILQLLILRSFKYLVVVTKVVRVAVMRGFSKGSFLVTRVWKFE